MFCPRCPAVPSGLFQTVGVGWFCRNTYREGGACAFLENIGFSELLLIFGAALLLFGPSKLPELGKSLGQGIREFKKATQAITEEVTKAATDQVATTTKSADAPTEAAPQAPLSSEAPKA